MTTALETFGVNTASSELATAGLLVKITGAPSAGVPTDLIGSTATGYSEVYGLGTTNPWQQASGIGNPSGHGWFFDGTTLDNQRIIAGNWTPIRRYSISNGSATVDMYCRFFKYTKGGIYILIGTASLLNQTLGTTLSNFSFGPFAFGAMDFSKGDRLYSDDWLNVTVNNSGNASATIHSSAAVVGTQGRANNVDTTTPGFIALPAESGGGLYRGRDRDRRN